MSRTCTWQGYVDFGNNTNNPLDSGFGFSNAVLGVFDQYLQQSKYVEGSLLYNNVEGYLQDNWKVTNRLTLDYGMRFTTSDAPIRSVQSGVELLPR